MPGGIDPRSNPGERMSSPILGVGLIANKVWSGCEFEHAMPFTD
jgi:hypothetical protein